MTTLPLSRWKGSGRSQSLTGLTGIQLQNRDLLQRSKTANTISEGNPPLSHVNLDRLRVLERQYPWQPYQINNGRKLSISLHLHADQRLEYISPLCNIRTSKMGWSTPLPRLTRVTDRWTERPGERYKNKTKQKRQRVKERKRTLSIFYILLHKNI